jgi:hypothetical protein
MSWWPHEAQRGTPTTMTADAVKKNCESRVARKRLFGWLGAATGLLAAGLAAETLSVVAQGSDYRSAATAPAAWQEFAKKLQNTFQQRLAADDDGARQFRDQMDKRAEEANAAPVTLIARTWILPDGNVERIEFDGLDQDVAVNLRALLAHGEVGVAPPDMLQPLHLRLSLRPKDQSGSGN